MEEVPSIFSDKIATIISAMANLYPYHQVTVLYVRIRSIALAIHLLHKELHNFVFKL